MKENARYSNRDRAVIISFLIIGTTLMYIINNKNPFIIILLLIITITIIIEIVIRI